jgi:hypothetical protein
VSPVKYELGYYIPDDDILHSHRREHLQSSPSTETIHASDVTLRVHHLADADTVCVLNMLCYVTMSDCDVFHVSDYVIKSRGECEASTTAQSRAAAPRRQGRKAGAAH